ncbi:uncharacterized protein LOC135333589 isoform X2 [Halichondria panicea]|uniref:uncharacterized protein LOC135333589 isoform X2 n=1 Tax=Halichondria panicea TaxID=6063 RepID=UPI00312B7E7E
MHSLYQRPRMHLLTTLILVHVAVHSSHGGRSVIFDWSPSVTTRQTLQLHLGDELILRCTENFISDIVRQTRAQVDACDSSIDNPNAKIPVSVNTCFGMVDTLSIPLETSSGMLPDAIVFQTGEYYYYTSYSVLNATQVVGGGLFDETSGGQCSAGLILELQILDDPTTDPPNVDNEASTMEVPDDPSTGPDNVDNVDNGNTDPTTNGGPGDININIPGRVGGLNGASRMGCCTYLTTVISVILCVLLSKFLY